MKIKKSVLKELVGVIELLSKCTKTFEVVEYNDDDVMTNRECSCCHSYGHTGYDNYISQINHKSDCLELQRLTLPDRIQALKASLGLVESDKGIEYGQTIEWGLKQPLSEHDKIMADYQETARQIDASVARLQQESLKQVNQF